MEVGIIGNHSDKVADEEAESDRVVKEVPEVKMSGWHITRPQM